MIVLVVPMLIIALHISFSVSGIIENIRSIDALQLLLSMFLDDVF